MSEEKICPGCGRHCDLSEPACERGEALRDTGVLPPRGENGAHNHDHGDRDRDEGRNHDHGELGERGEHSREHGERGRRCERRDEGRENCDRRGRDEDHSDGRDHRERGERDERCERGERRGCPGERGEMWYAREGAGDVDARLAAALRDVGHAMRFLREDRGGQRQVLALLGESGSTTQKELTERLGIRPGSASEIIAKLEGAGLVAREQSSDDRRTMVVSLTPEGEKRAAEESASRDTNRAEMFGALSDEEKAELLRLLEKLGGDWSGRYERGRGRHGCGRGERREHSHHDRDGERGAGRDERDHGARGERRGDRRGEQGEHDHHDRERVGERDDRDEGRGERKHDGHDRRGEHGREGRGKGHGRG